MPWLSSAQKARCTVGPTEVFRMENTQRHLAYHSVLLEIHPSSPRSSSWKINRGAFPRPRHLGKLFLRPRPTTDFLPSYEESPMENSHPSGRREFLKGTAATRAVVAIANAAVPTSTASTEENFPPVKLGINGCDMMGTRHITCLWE